VAVNGLDVDGYKTADEVRCRMHTSAYVSIRIRFHVDGYKTADEVRCRMPYAGVC
jgi:hypothetical protein